MVRRLPILLAVLCVPLLLGASPGTARRWDDVLIKDVPFVVQRPDFCGEACVEMYLKKLGVAGDQNDVFALTGVDPVLGRGAYTGDLSRALVKIGFDPGDVWHTVSPPSASEELDAEWSALHEDLVRGVPSIVCTRYDFKPDTTEHFRLILGYDAKRDEVIFHDPARVGGNYLHMRRQDFLSLWPLKYEKDKWTVIRLRLAPAAKLAVTRNPSPAEFAQHVRQLKARVGAEAKDFTFIVQPPFIVLGNEPPAAVQARAKHIVEWTSAQLKSLYFEKDPERILDVWLLKDEASYEQWATDISGAKPSTPYGYYSSLQGALVMNIATGGGTLVHELVHAYMEPNFNAPSWLNEGLGSLYEQSSERDGKIVGLTNWRLAGLQKAIRAGSVPTFKALLSTSSDEFYGEDSGTNYAQSRYLLYYLQENGLLLTFWKELLANHAADPTGYETLKKVLGEKDMDAFQKRWEKWVLTLHFP